MNEVEQQLVEGLDGRVAWTLEILGWHDLADEVRRRLPDAAQRYALQLSDPNDAAEIVIDLAGVAWDADPAPEWWSTPVGRLVARSVETGSVTGLVTGSVTQQRAADMLGVTRGTVAQLVHRGSLERHPDGGVAIASVVARLLSRPR